MDTLPSVIEQYVRPGKLLFAYRHLPLEAIHPAAIPAAEAAECARRQNQFWNVHDLLFANVRQLATFDFAAVGGRVGLDPRAFTECLTSHAAAMVRQDIASARRMGIGGTPTFLFGHNEGGTLRVLHRESGAIPFQAFAGIVDRLLSERGNGTSN